VRRLYRDRKAPTLEVPPDQEVNTASAGSIPLDSLRVFQHFKKPDGRHPVLPALVLVHVVQEKLGNRDRHLDSPLPPV